MRLQKATGTFSSKCKINSVRGVCLRCDGVQRCPGKYAPGKAFGYDMNLFKKDIHFFEFEYLNMPLVLLFAQKG